MRYSRINHPKHTTQLIFAMCVLSANADIGADDFKAANAFPKHLYKAIKSRVATKGDLHGNLSATRTLKSNDVGAILVFSDIVMDKRRTIGERASAADCLGALGHRFGIPGLLSVIRDKTEVVELRIRAINALSRISNQTAVDHLVQALRNKNLSKDLQIRINNQLVLMTNRKSPGAKVKSGTQRYKPLDWKAWWKKHRKTAKLSREATMVGAFP